MPHKNVSPVGALTVSAFLIFSFQLAGSTPEFERNIGQAPAEAVFLGRVGQARAYVEDSAIEVRQPGQRAVRFGWVDAKLPAQPAHGWTAREATGNTYYYCNGTDSKLCAQAVPGHRRIVRHDLYRGIDWTIYGRSEHLEYDLIVRPGANLAQVRLRVEGASAELDAQGQLRTAQVLQWRPEAYQWVDGEKLRVGVEFRRLSGGEFGFDAGEYRRDVDLVIDPVIEGLAVSGGAGDDVTLGTSPSGAYRYGTTRSAHWNGMPGFGGTDVFVQFKGTAGLSTVFWGGDGDEEIGGADFELVNSRLFLAGWTNSRNAHLLSPRYSGRPREYAGGATDGFVLAFGHGMLSFASYFGGPGADRLYQARHLRGIYTNTEFAISGETTDAAWPGAQVMRIGAGGKIDAIAGAVDEADMKIAVIGGAGDDRAMRLLQVDQEMWAIAGETDSNDFPSLAGATVAAARDIWTGLIRFEPTEVTTLRLYGGNGNEQLGGLASISGEGSRGEGLYIAGTTDSPDLPVRSNSYNGGKSDGFVAHLDPTTAPLATTYLGGDGQDEIAAITADRGDLYLGGTTDSPDLRLQGPALAAPAGGLDGLVVVCDAFANPMTAIRIGGAGDDRIHDVQPVEAGKAVVAGSSASSEWFRRLDENASGRGGRDGFTLTLGFATTAVSPAFGSRADATETTLHVGQNLQDTFDIRAISEPGMDGMLVVRSSDPSRLLVSARTDTEGGEVVLLREADVDGGMRQVTLQALAGSGEVDVTIEGRSRTSAASAYPQRRLRVKLAPAGLFVASSTAQQDVRLNAQVNIEVLQAPVLPSGRPGRPQRLRAGLSSPVTLSSSDTAALRPRTDGAREQNIARFIVSLEALREGIYTLTPGSQLIPAAPGQVATVRVRSSTASNQRVFLAAAVQIPKDHAAVSYLDMAAGDELRFTSEDPVKVLVGATDLSLAEVVTIRHTGASVRPAILIAGRQRSGDAFVRVEGTFRGVAIQERMRIRLIPYRARLVAPRTAPVGNAMSSRVEITPLYATDDEAQTGGGSLAKSASAFAGARLRVSDPEILEIRTQDAEPLTFSLTGRRPGVVMLDFEPGGPAELSGLRASVEVIPQRLDFGAEEILIPAGTVMTLFPAPFLSHNPALQVRLRLSGDAPVKFAGTGDSGKEIVANFSGGQGVALSSENAAPGQRATLSVSAPGVSNHSIPIRVVEAVLMPRESEVSVVAAANNRQDTASVHFDVQAYVDGRVVGLPFRTVSFTSTGRFRAMLTPAGVCEVSDFSTQLSVTVRCLRSGETVLSLLPGAGIADVQPQYTVRIRSRAATEVLRIVPDRILLGKGLQTLFTPRISSGLPSQETSFSGTLTSNDPERVRLSSDPKARGTDRMTINASRPVPVYVQAFGSEGVVTLTAESTSGLRQDIAVYLFASTMAVRAVQESIAQDQSADTSIRQALSESGLTLGVAPYLVEPVTGKLLWTHGLSIIGGTDPVFLRGQSSDETIAEPISPGALLSEADESASVQFQVKRTGEAVLRVSQPEGFVSIDASALHIRVFERMLTIGSPVLAANMQTPVQTRPEGGYAPGVSLTANVTMTSLDPAKLSISASATSNGQVTLVKPISEAAYLEALPGVAPGEKARVRLESPGYETSEVEVNFAAAELQLNGVRPISLRASAAVERVGLAYGPIDNGQVRSDFNGRMRAGLEVQLRVASSDPSVLQVVRPDVRLDRFSIVELRTLRPGTAELLITAPPGITNRAERVPVVIAPFEFSGIAVETGAQYLVSKIALRNPRAAATAITLASTGEVPLRFAAVSGANAQSTNPLTLSLGPNEQRTVYYEATGPGRRAIVRVSAPDFAPRDEHIDLGAPHLSFGAAPAVAFNLTSGTAQVPVVLTAQDFSPQELPLGTSLGTLRVQLQSSNAQVARVPGAPVEIAPGASRAVVPLQLVGRGDAVITIVTPAGFDAGSRRDLLVTVR